MSARARRGRGGAARACVGFGIGGAVSVFEHPAALLERLDRGAGSVHVVAVANELPNLGCPTLLRQARQRHPQVVRVVLTDAGGPTVFQRIPYAHQFFRRSAPPSELAAALARSIDSRALLARPELRALVASGNASPAAPSVDA